MLPCPKCESKKTQPVTDDGARWYCVECNHAWHKSNGADEPKGNLNFDGIPKARQIFEVLTKGQDITPEMRAALESQVAALLLDQWFEGFKGGQMASILYAKEYYDGKNRNDSKPTVVGSNQGKRRSGLPGKNRGSGPVQDSADPRFREDNPTIEERINGGVLRYPRGTKVPPIMFQEVAGMIEDMPGFFKKEFTWDGKNLTVAVDW